MDEFVLYVDLSLLTILNAELLGIEWCDQRERGGTGDPSDHSLLIVSTGPYKYPHLLLWGQIHSFLPEISFKFCHVNTDNTLKVLTKEEQIQYVPFCY